MREEKNVEFTFRTLNSGPFVSIESEMEVFSYSWQIWNANILYEMGRQIYINRGPKWVYFTEFAFFFSRFPERNHNFPNLFPSGHHDFPILPTKTSIICVFQTKPRKIKNERFFPPTKSDLESGKQTCHTQTQHITIKNASFMVKCCACAHTKWSEIREKIGPLNCLYWKKNNRVSNVQREMSGITRCHFANLLYVVQRVFQPFRA